MAPTAMAGTRKTFHRSLTTRPCVGHRGRAGSRRRRRAERRASPRAALTQPGRRRGGSLFDLLEPAVAASARTTEPPAGPSGRPDRRADLDRQPVGDRARRRAARRSARTRKAAVSALDGDVRRARPARRCRRPASGRGTASATARPSPAGSASSHGRSSRWCSRVVVGQPRLDERPERQRAEDDRPGAATPGTNGHGIVTPEDRRLDRQARAAARPRASRRTSPAGRATVATYGTYGP